MEADDEGLLAQLALPAIAAAVLLYEIAYLGSVRASWAGSSGDVLLRWDATTAVEVREGYGFWHRVRAGACCCRLADGCYQVRAGDTVFEVIARKRSRLAT